MGIHARSASASTSSTCRTTTASGCTTKVTTARLQTKKLRRATRRTPTAAPHALVSSDRAFPWSAERVFNVAYDRGTPPPRQERAGAVQRCMDERAILVLAVKK